MNVCQDLRYVFEMGYFIAVIAASYVAIKEVNAWKNEALGRKKIEIAEKLYPLITRLPIVVNQVRSRNYSLLDGENTRHDYSLYEAILEQDDRFKLLLKLYRKRFDYNEAFFQQLLTESERFIFYFGDEFTTDFEKVRVFLLDIKFSLEQATLLGTPEGILSLEDCVDKLFIADDSLKDQFNIEFLKLTEKLQHICKATIEVRKQQKHS